MQKSRVDAYSHANLEKMSAREIETALLMKGITLLKECKEKWGKAKHSARLRGALDYNVRIWTFFQNELMQPRHPLSYEVKENIIRLGIYVAARAQYINEDPSPDKLDAIININMNLASGMCAKKQTYEAHSAA